jgi:hypothetical protein
MIDDNLLISLGWSEELIRAARDVSLRVESAKAHVTYVCGIGEVIVAGPPSGSHQVDVSAPPVAGPQVRVDGR